MKLSAYHASLLATLLAKGNMTVAWETAVALVSAGALTTYQRNATRLDTVTIYGASLTDAGIKLARERAAVIAAQKTKRASGARLRADAMRSVGLVRTRSGAWE